METGQLNRLCGSFRARLRWLLVQAGVARFVVLAIILLAALLGLDWWAHLHAALRVVALLGYLAALAGALWWTLLSPLRRRWSDREVLSYADAVLAASGAGDGAMLLDLYELTEAAEAGQIPELESPVGRALAASAVEELAGIAAKVDLAATLQRRNVKRWLSGAAAAAALLAVVAASPGGRPYLGAGVHRLFNPFSDVRWPHRTTIDDLACRIGEKTIPESRTGWAVPQLESMTVLARVSGEVPPDVTLYYRGQKAAKYWDKAKLPVSEDGRVSYTFENVRDPIEFYLVGGDYETNGYTVGVIERPYLKTITAHYTFPAYAGVPNKVEQGSELAGLEGTSVRVVFESSMKLAKAVLVPDEGLLSPEDVALTGPTTFEKTFVLAKNATYSVELHEEHGFAQARPERINIRVTPDNPPTVELLAPGPDLIETNQSTLDVAFRASDDFGLNKLEFYYQVDNGPAVLLGDRITGPVPQNGRDSGDVHFAWALRKVELPESCTLTCFAKAADGNPTGRGQVESRRAQIKLVAPTAFQLEALERSKGLLAEARLAWQNQLAAYQFGQQYLQKGTGQEDDPLWRDLSDKQQGAFAAAKAMKVHLRTLTEAYERNGMSREFMAGRLNKIAELLNQLLDTEHPAIDDGLRVARPKTAADAVADRLKQLRSGSLGKFKDNQRMAVLVIERLRRKLYDWRDLQTSTVTTRLLIEQQDDVIKQTNEIAPKTIGADILDLSDADQEKLLTLGKQQRAIFDTEDGLEKQLAYLIHKAEREKRESIREPLAAAFKGLRGNRVNDHLKQAADMIANNQPSQVGNSQKAVVRALQTVEGGLIATGQKVEEDKPIQLADAISEKDVFEDVDKPAEEKTAEGTATQPGGETVAMDDSKLLEFLPETTDPLSAAIRMALELQDNVRARTRYLFENGGPAEMPRFITLKRLMLVERQEAASAGLDRAIAEAAKAELKTLAVREVLAGEREEFTQFERLAAAHDVSECHQQAQSDSKATLADLLQLIALDKAVDESTAENKRLNGFDAFKRQYLIRDQALDAVVGVISQAKYALLLESDVVRKLQRFAKYPAGTPLVIELEKANRARTAAAQKKLAAMIDEVIVRSGTLSSEVSERVRQAGVGGLADLQLGSFADRISAGKVDDQAVAALQAAEHSLAGAVQGLKDLLEERVRPPEVKLAAATQPEPVTVEEIRREESPERLAELLKNDTALPPRIRDRMIQALARDKEFPAKYRELLSAYYSSFIPQGEKKAE